MEELRRIWAANIRFGRRALKMTQQDLADKITPRVTQQTVARWEAGLVAPRDEHKRAIAAALHQDARTLFPLTKASA